MESNLTPSDRVWSSDRSRTSEMRVERLVLAITQVASASVAIAIHGDESTLRTARAANVPLIEATISADGRLVKMLGEGMLLAFPADRAEEAVTGLRSARDQATAIWQRFDPRCYVQVKMNVGNVLVGAIGAPADLRLDVYGHVLHQLFKAPAAEFTLLSELAALIGK
jgi:class 3 adenylate cyclase